MIEKVNPCHVDKLADRIAGAIVDLAYKKVENPKVAVEALLGHQCCHVIIETSEDFSYSEIQRILKRIVGDCELDLLVVPQDKNLAENQRKLRCGDNGIFKGVPLTNEQKSMSMIARMIYDKFRFDGKYIYDSKGQKLIICQSNAERDEIFDLLTKIVKDDCTIVVNPLGSWTGGFNVDTGATNRKLGSDMADSVTGGGLHGKDLSKADVSVNIYAFLKAQETGQEVNLCCAIGDEYVDGKPYEEIVEIARNYINKLGGFEKLADWGLF